MAIDRTEAALEITLKLLAALEDSDGVLLGDTPMPGTLSEIRDTVAGALSSIRQQPVQLRSIDLFVRLRSEVVAAGSETALALKMGITRQSLSDVVNARRQAGPAILDYLGLRRITTVRYEHAEPQPKAEPKPRSERRQRAWDGLPPVSASNEKRMEA